MVGEAFYIAVMIVMVCVFIGLIIAGGIAILAILPYLLLGGIALIVFAYSPILGLVILGAELLYLALKNSQKQVITSERTEDPNNNEKSDTPEEALEKLLNKGYEDRVIADFLHVPKSYIAEARLARSNQTISSKDVNLKKPAKE